MMRHVPKGAFLLVFLAGAATLHAQPSLKDAWNWYARRAENAGDFKADPGPILKAIALFEKAMADPYTELDAAVGILRSYNFYIEYCLDKPQRLAVTTKVLGIAAAMGAKYPAVSEFKYYHAEFLGKQGNLRGFDMSQVDLPNRLKSLMEEIIRMDPSYDRGAAYLFLGRLHHKAPNIPVVLPWPSKTEAERLLKKALDMAPRSLTAQRFYAELLADTGRRSEAIALLRAAARQNPGPERLVEELRALYEIREKLRELGG